MVCLPFECIETGLQLAAHDLVEETASLCETSIDDLPLHAWAPAGTPYESFPA
jgi:hypothetical protein